MSDWTNEASTQAGIIDRERAFGNSLGVNPTGELGDPVNTLTGGFVTSVTDLMLPGIGLPFAFERSYNSADTATGALGVGWSHPFETSLSFPNSTKVKVKGTDGQRMTFTKQADGTYKGETGARVQLVALPGAYEVRHFDGSLERYDTYGQLYQVKDHNGNKLTMTARSGAGHVSSITDSVGRVITLGYNANHLLSSVTLPDGRSVRYAYTPNGLLQTVTDVRGGTMTYSYDDAKRLTKIVDQNGNAIVTSTYNTKGRVMQQLDSRGNQWLYDWNTHTQTATVTDPRGNTYKDIYRGNVLRRRIDPLGNITAFDYDSDLNVVAVTDPRSKTTTMTYDARGNMLARTAPAPLSYQESWTYNAQNRPLSYANGRGRTTTFQYDSKGNLDLVEQPGNVVTDYVRDSATGLLTSIIDPRSKTTRFTYDAQGNLIEVQSPAGGVVRYVHDSSGRVIDIIDPRGTVAGANPNDYKTTLAYNAANQVTSVRDPLGNVGATAYDAGGRVTSVTNPKNRVTSYSYNAANLLTSVTAPDSTVTTYAYDSAGNLISRTDARSHTTSYAYDALNRLIRSTSPTGQRWDYDYDAGSNVIRITDAIGNSTAAAGDGVTTYTYDAVNRVSGIDYSDATPDVSFAYDGNGNVISMGDGAGMEVYAYDDLDRLTTVTRGSDVFSYEYDKATNLTRRTYPDGTVSDLTYDDDSRLTSVTTGGRVTSYSYGPAGDLTSTTFPAANGHVETRAYDRAGDLASIVTTRGSNILAEATYVRDAAGNPTRLTTMAGEETYKYDSLERLTEVCYQATCSGASDPFIRYTYDAVGNRLTEERPGATTTYDYNAADQLVSSTTGGTTTSYEHDANGNMTGAGPRTFAYDLADRMTSTTQGGSTTAYEYDGVGKRLKVDGGPSDVTKFLWDANMPLAQLALERDGNNGLIRRYEYGLNLISSTTGSASHYFHRDGIGSVSNVTDAHGVPQWSYAYDPFGNSRSATKVDPVASENRMRYTGEYLDPTGLYHLRARQYNPVLGAFTATDPLPAGPSDPYVSSYVYVNNRPTMFIDPTGLFCVLGHNPNGSCRGSGSAIYNWDGWYDLNDSVGGVTDGLTHIPFTDTSLTGELRDHMVDGGIALGVNECSWGYGYANRIGQLSQAGLTLAAAAAPSTISALNESYTFGRTSNLFGRWGIGRLNRGPVRIGWGWKGRINREVFRIGIGGEGHRIWWHIDIL